MFESIGMGILLVLMLGMFLQAFTTNFVMLGVVGNPNFDALLSTTLANYRSQFSDNLSRSFFLFWWLNSRERKRMENGGESIVVQLMYGKNTTIKSYSGYEVLDTTPQEGLTSVKFPWKQVAGSVAISRLEERQNSGESRLINLLASKVTQAEISMRDELNRMFYADGTGNASKDIFGLQLLVENGAAWGTLGGIDRSDALNLWWRNQWSNMTGVSFATTGISRMRTVYNSASRGNEHPDIGICDQTTFERYEAKLEAAERFTQQDVGDAGFQNLKFKGMVLGYDEQCTGLVAGGLMYMLNSRYLEWVVDSETDLVNTEFVRPENQDAKVSQILLMANLVTSNAARQAVLDGIDTA
jgi:hypothetical protein